MLLRRDVLGPHDAAAFLRLMLAARPRRVLRSYLNTLYTTLHAQGTILNGDYVAHAAVMRLGHGFAFVFLLATGLCTSPAPQIPLRDASNDRTISVELFAELEELARIVDITYCVGLTGLGIQKPFECLGRCSDFKNFELVTVCSYQPVYPTMPC